MGEPDKAANSAPVRPDIVWDTAVRANRRISVETETQPKGGVWVVRGAPVGALPAYLALAVGIGCISWSAIFVRWTDIPGPASAFYRMLIPAVVLLPTFLFDRGRTRLNGQMLWIIALGGLFFALDLAFYNTSILKTSAANATLLGNNTPIFVGLLSWMLFKRRPGISFWAGLAMAMAGGGVVLNADLGRHAKM